jgi:hypothetical protein
MKWIKIDKEMPPIQIEVRLKYKFSGIGDCLAVKEWETVGRWFPSKFKPSKIHWVLKPSEGVNYSSVPTHWMPLPEPPK